ncbi:helix-turn-helix transcriptional regulator [Candidatus Lariskella endosymbiont of Epinotia ramella]|uniref:helix-turn-helix domain-containing protein n=1 Tax=Candidatus Lariskella endosymbiont of Epinotia ramella TaxID=3066224 RepID=UPI0030D2C28D
MSKKKATSAHPVDIYVGMRLRKKRQDLGVSQETLANAVDLTFQQIQKYEKGLNRISCSKLHDVAKFLKTDIKYFFSGLEEYDNSRLLNVPSGAALHENGSQYKSHNSDFAELQDAFDSIKQKELKKSIINIVQNLALN